MEALITFSILLVVVLMVFFLTPQKEVVLSSSNCRIDYDLLRRNAALIASCVSDIPKGDCMRYLRMIEDELTRVRRCLEKEIIPL